MNAIKRYFLRIRVARNIFNNRVTFIQKNFLFSIQHLHFIFLLYITSIIRINIKFIITLLLYSQHIFNAYKVLYAIINLTKTKTTTKTNIIQQRSEN